MKHRHKHRIEKWEQKAKYKSVLSRFLLSVILAPITVLFFSSFVGPDLESALHTAISMIWGRKAVASYLVLFITSVATIFWLRPVFHFLMVCDNPDHNSRTYAAKTLERIEHLPKFVIILSVVGFLAGGSLEMITNPAYNSFNASVIWRLCEVAASGLFTATLISLTIDNVMFPVKKRISDIEPGLLGPYRSFYLSLFFAIFTMLLFLAFQIFATSSNFFLVGSKATGHALNDFMDSARFLNVSANMDGMNSAMQVLLVRIFLFFLISLQMIRLLEKRIRDPLTVIQSHLERINTADVNNIREITILNNDEFAPMYREINEIIARQQKELSTSRVRLENIVNNAADPILSYDGKGNIIMSNPAAENLVGLKTGEILGRNIDDFLIHGTVCFSEFRATEQGRLQRAEVKRPDGSTIPVEANYSTCSSNNEHFNTVILRDIRLQIQHENALNEARRAAENANRMKSEFLANMSHELRTPLNAVLGYTQLMEDDQNLTDGQKDKIRTISNSGSHLLALINDILDISKIEAGKFEINESAFSLVQFTEDVQDMFQLKCREKGLSFYVEYIGELPKYVKGDLGKLRQIIINLLSNAVKFTNEGGIALAVGTDGDNIRFSIRDTGKGIPLEEQEDILKPFTQASNTDHEGGTGLGLAISSRFVSMMGGKLELESRQGEGSTFSFAIPMEEATESSVHTPVASRVRSIDSASPGGSHPTALVVDDKVDNRLILKEMLERVGFTVIEAKDGREAVEITSDKLPQLVFMDMKMPVMDGYAAVEELKASEATRDIPVFALTASAFKHDEQKIRSAGFNGFLAKPFQQQALFALIEENSEIVFIRDSQDSAPQDEGGFDAAGADASLNLSVVARALGKEQLEDIDDALMINDFTRISQIAASIADSAGADSDTATFASLLGFYAANYKETALQSLNDRLMEASDGI